MWLFFMLFGGTIQLFSIIFNLKYIYISICSNSHTTAVEHFLFYFLLNVERISHLKQNNSKIEFLFFLNLGWDELR